MGAQFVFRLLSVIACLGYVTHSFANDAPEVRIGIEQRGVAFLRSLPREWSGTSDRDCKTYEDKNVERLVSYFAAAAADFLNSFRHVHGAVTITSAHRSVT